MDISSKVSKEKDSDVVTSMIRRKEAMCIKTKARKHKISFKVTLSVNNPNAKPNGFMVRGGV